MKTWLKSSLNLLLVACIAWLVFLCGLDLGKPNPVQTVKLTPAPARPTIKPVIITVPDCKQAGTALTVSIKGDWYSYSCVAVPHRHKAKRKITIPILSNDQWISPMRGDINATCKPLSSPVIQHCDASSGVCW